MVGPLCSKPSDLLLAIMQHKKQLSQSASLSMVVSDLAISI